MKRKISKVLITSICLNVILFLMLSGVAYYKREGIKNRIRKVFPHEIVSEKNLKQFNKEPYEFSNGTIETGNKEKIKILFLGNSLTYTGVPEEEPDKERRGLTSTSKEKDYAHQLMKMINEKKKVDIDYSVLNISTFERTFSDTAFDYSQLEKCVAKNPDYLIVQIGENISNDDMTNYSTELEKQYAQLLLNFPESIKIICIPFWPDKNKQNVITKIAVDNNVYLVDLSHLGNGTDSENYASSYKKYKQPGVGEHPGDYGMKNIADNLFTVINCTMK